MMRPIPPLALALVAGASQAAIARGRRSTRGSRIAAAAVAVPSVALLVGSARAFRRAGTTVDPRQGVTSDALVTGGPNALSRNPMYVGMAGMLLSHAAARRSIGALVPAVAFTAWIDRIQIPMEEVHLTDRFPKQFTAYRNAVPRWIGRPRTPRQR
ncbi:methyltransferase family protein [Aeromicrobium sp. CTD01-1L150]|uniref:methyltransferase family protein n=1 Tax=Aeromicrobium sp. CTD01-1L150 TaxID=3341830 RepID=UPI0035BFFE0B